MTIRSTPLRFGALVLAAGAISLSGSAAWAFSMENLRVGGDGNRHIPTRAPRASISRAPSRSGPNGPLPSSWSDERLHMTYPYASAHAAFRRRRGDAPHERQQRLNGARLPPRCLGLGAPPCCRSPQRKANLYGQIDPGLCHACGKAGSGSARRIISSTAPSRVAWPELRRWHARRTWPLRSRLKPSTPRPVRYGPGPRPDSA